MTDLRLTPGGLMSDAGGLEPWRLTAWWGGLLAPDAGGLAACVRRRRDGALAPYGVVGVASWHSTPGGVAA
ncbi:hypothetical protein OHB10_27450 [Streptomyces sp. NBC_01597]|uniref:hypothetical protein n=1 Tax=Streptomyces sp. NBC_01597 TaxID=2975891 RepID=UPI00386AD857